MKRLCMGCMHEYDDKYNICPFCGYVYGTPAKEAYHLSPGYILNDKYIIGKVLGFGGFGITYIAFDKILEQRVAIKEYMPGEFSTRMPEQKTVTVFSGEREEQFKDGLIKIELEAKKLSKFSSVPNIVHIFDCFQANNTVYIVMEYLEGETLKEKISREGKLPVQYAFDIVMKVISAMKKVHEEGIIHRDIAPDNIFILKNGDIKVIDFGAARYATTKHSKSLSVIIKPGYAPEEQYRSRGDQGPHTDVYALAATFYKMITGVTPEDAMERSVHDMLKKPSKLGIEISKPMETALMNALMVNIDDRTPTMDDFEKELNDADVKERKKTAAKDITGKISLPVKIGIVVGIAIIAISSITVFSMNFAPKLVAESIFGDKEIPVPNLINQSIIDARKYNSDIKILEDEDYSDNVLLGKIINQDPAPGTTVSKGTKVRVKVSVGREPKIIPNVVGMRIDEAQKSLEGLFNLVEVKEADGDMSLYPPGVVVSQSLGAYSDTVIPGEGESIILFYNNNGFDLNNYTASDTDTLLPNESDIKNQMFAEIQKSYYDNKFIFLSPEYVIKDGDKYVLSSDEKKEIQLDGDIDKGKIFAIDTESGKNIDNLLHVYVYDGVKPFKLEAYRGSSFTDIQNKLSKYSINVDVQYSYDSTVDINSIIEIKNVNGEVLEQGALLNEGDSVTMIVNTGIAPNDNSELNTLQQDKRNNNTNQSISETVKSKPDTSSETKPVKSTQDLQTEGQNTKETEAKPKKVQHETEAPKVDSTKEYIPPTTMAPEVVEDFIND